MPCVNHKHLQALSASLRNGSSRDGNKKTRQAGYHMHILIIKVQKNGCKVENCSDIAITLVRNKGRKGSHALNDGG